MADLVTSTTHEPPHVARSLRSDFDFSLYLVTGRDLLPHGKVLFFAICCFFINLFSRATWLLLVRSVLHPTYQQLTHSIRRLFEGESQSYKSAKKA